MITRTVRVILRRELFHRAVFRIEEGVFQFERFDGSMSQEITRLVLNRGDSVAVLLHDPAKQQVLLSEQFRYPTYEHGPGWLLELPAGMLEPGENEEECACRETLEETGYKLHGLSRIACVYLSPGGSSERVHVFYAAISLGDRINEGGGIMAEGEDIRLISMTTEDAISRVRDGQIIDAKTLIAIQWLELAGVRESLRHK